MDGVCLLAACVCNRGCACAHRVALIGPTPSALNSVAARRRAGAIYFIIFPSAPPLATKCRALLATRGARLQEDGRTPIRAVARSPINLVAVELLSEDLLAARAARLACHQQAEPVRLVAETTEPLLPPASPPAVPLGPFRSPARVSPSRSSLRAAHLSASPSATSNSGSCSRAAAGTGRAEGSDASERLVGRRVEPQRQILRPHPTPGDGELLRPGSGLRAVLQREIEELQAHSRPNRTPQPNPNPNPNLNPNRDPDLTPPVPTFPTLNELQARSTALAIRTAIAEGG